MDCPKNFRSHLCNTVDNFELSFMEEWVPEMVMPVQPCTLNSGNNLTPIDQDILTHVTGARQGGKLYFPSDIYSVEGGFNGNGWTILLKDLQISAFDAGFTLVSNGKPFKNSSSIVLICNHARRYKGIKLSNPSLQASTPGSQYKTGRATHQKLTSRGIEGRSLPRRRNTILPETKDKRCKFLIYLSHDNKGFFEICR